MDTNKAEPIDSSWSSRNKIEELHESHTKLIGLHHDATARLNKFERRLDKLDSDTDDSDTASEASLEDDYRLGFEEKVIHEVRDVDFEHFKNRYTEKDGKYCIEVLVAGSNLQEEVRRELKRRDLLDSDELRPGDNDDELGEQIIHRVRIQSPSLLFLLHSVLENDYANSSFLWKGQNRMTFFRPFTWFVHVQDKMKLKLGELENQFSGTQFPPGAATWPTVAELVTSFEESAILEKQSVGRESAQDSEDKTAGIEQYAMGAGWVPLPKRVDRHILETALLESYETLLALRCYVGFVDKRIIPDATKHKRLDAPDQLSVRYQDLSYLFQVGELVCVRIPGHGLDGPRIARVRQLIKPDASTLPWGQDYIACVPRRRKTRNTLPINTFAVDHYTVDYNGVKYTTHRDLTSIDFFNGQMEITSLAIYPLRFHSDKEKLAQTAQDSGKKFRDAVASKHMLYCGWSRPTKPPPQPQPGRIPQERFQSEVQESDETFNLMSLPPSIREAAFHMVNYIESDVIVDVKEAVRAIPYWAIPNHVLTYTNRVQQDWSVVQDKIEIIRWADRHRKTAVSTIQDRTQVEDCILALQSKAFLKENKFSSGKQNPILEEEDLVLLPQRLYAYALRERKFFSGAIESFFKITTGGDPFESLKIDDKHIRIVQSVVWSHFQRKSMESSSILHSHMDQDLIRGKGRGLVILLHGAPGVGKTATAEAVALWHRKPLFVITCGDLGFTPESAESSLSDIFRLAHLWDCILLLDEADVFLSQRETNALRRNALVSVFYEYYNGILFLTTNRVGTLDEAFKSRVHLSLYYPALGRSQTEQIMRMNLERLGMIENQRTESTSQIQLFIRKDQICKFVAEHWDRHVENDGEGRWNGRQIRNAVQIAASLALYDKQTDRDEGAQGIPPVLDERHFEIVEQTMTLFEGYMTKTRGGSAALIASMRNERDDRFKAPQPRVPRDTLYESSATSGYGLGGYTPYQNRPRTPQYPGVPQPYPATQQYPQHLSPPGPPHKPMGMSAAYLTTEPVGHISAQTEFYGHTTQQHMPGGIPGPFEPEKAYNTTVSAPPNMYYPSRDVPGGGGSRQGHDPLN
ncbi:hypothetical protein F4678DRAFT_466486 [Xylaria arbuscula]|nr:hypothetical protein F4678DRAFT_466486 [Xylaria arbuscula]